MRRSTGVLLASASTGVACVLALVVPLPAVAAASRAPGPARHVRAGSVRANSLVLSWRNPASKKFRTTLVRARRGSSAPKSIHAGSRVATVSRRHHSVTVRHLKSGTTYSFSVFAGDGHGHWAHAATLRTGTATTSPTGPRAYEEPAGTLVRWTNPRTGLHHVTVRYAKGAAAPTSPSRGTGLRVAARATSARLSRLSADTRYAVSVFAIDRYGHASAPAVVRFTTPAKPSGPVPGGTYEGRVVDSHGTPLVNADVVAYSYSDAAPERDTRTGPDGRFQLSLSAGRWWVGADGADATGGDSDATGYAYTAGGVTITSGHTVAAGDLALAPGGIVTGRITDTAGEPLAGASVYLGPVDTYVDEDGGGGISYATDFDGAGLPVTGSDGTFSLRGVPGGSALRVCAFAEHGIASGATSPAPYLNRCSGRSVLPQPGGSIGTLDLRLRHGAGGTVTGTASGAGGAPLSGGLVQLVSASDDDFPGAALLGADGSFRLPNIAPGKYQVCAQAPDATAKSPTGYAPACSRTVTVTTGGLTTTTVTLPVGAAISGRVTTTAGRPVANIRVQASGSDKPGADSTTDATGHYRVTGLSAGSYHVCFDGSDVVTAAAATGVLSKCFSGGRVAVAAKAVRTGIDGALPIGGAISGRVLDASGSPVPDAFVFAGRAGDDEDDSDGGSAVTDAAGRYTVLGLTAGAYDVCASDPNVDDFGDGTCRRTSTTVRPRATARGADIVVPAQSGVTVSVRDADQAPVAGVDAVAVSACSEDECEPDPALDPKIGVLAAATSVTDADGATRLTGLRPGSYAVCLHAYYGTTASGGSPTGYADTCTGPDAAGKPFAIRVTAGSMRHVDLVLNPGGVVTGRVTDTSGAPLAGVVAHVEGSAADNGARDTDFSGTGPSGDDEDYIDYDLDHDSGSFGTPLDDSVTDAGGRYSVLGVRPGDSRICADAADASGPAAGGYLNACRTAPAKAVHVVAGQTTDAGDLALAPGALITGTARARTSSGKAGAGLDEVLAFVFADGDDEPLAQAQTRSDGRYQVRQLPPGKYRVCFLGYSSDRGSQCYDRIAWTIGFPPPLSKAKAVTVPVAGQVTGVDALLPKQ